MRHLSHLLLLFLLLLPGCGRDEDAWFTVQETGVLRVGLDPTYPRLQWLQRTIFMGLM